MGHPGTQFHASEIIRRVGSGSGAVQRELEKLSDAGILNVTASGNRKLYYANRQSPIFAELRALIMKTAGLVEPLRLALAPFRTKIDLAFIYGSVAKGRDTAKSDVDLMIIGQEIAYSEMYLALQKTEKLLLRTINPSMMTPAEWSRRLTGKNSFIGKIFQQPRLFVFGTENELKRIR